MALDALFHQTDAGINAADMRRLVNGFAGGRPGILNYGDFLGSATSTTNFRVAAGIGIVGHNSSSIERFLISNTANVDQTITAPGSGTKYITVYARVQDATLGDGSNTVTVTKNETTDTTFGIPAGQSGIELYRITLPSGQTLLSGATITDVRKYAKPWNVPWGAIGVGERRSSWGPVTANVTAAVMGLGSCTIVTGRQYKFTFSTRATVATTGRWAMTLRDDAGTTQYYRVYDNNDNPGVVVASGSHLLQVADLGGAGTRVYELWAGCTSDVQTLSLTYSATDTSGPSFTSAILEDIGPLANY